METTIPTPNKPAYKNTPAPLSLREDLQLLAAPGQDDGAPSWTIYDPVQQKYFRIGWLEFEILSRWHSGDSEMIARKVNEETTLTISEGHVEALKRFLSINNLLQTENHEQIYQQFLSLNRQGFIARMLKSYLFIRIPLWQPDNFLTATAPLVRLFFTPFFWKFLFLFGVIGAYLTMRQWNSFQQTFLYFFSTEGVLYYAAVLTVTKALHELGHAYTAKRYGLHVPTMGVAFILFWPILFTDTTEAWRLISKKQRLLIGSAGIMVELITAVTATFCWNFLPEGPLKGAVFLLASTTWLVTLSINLNPFMRFDGYYILSDLLGVANLQPRAFALGKWRLRKAIFGLKTTCPENLPDFKRNILILYSYGTWIYRFFLFLGISFIIYQFTFKLLGLFLMAVQITMFITLPVFRELKVWWNSRRLIGFNFHLFSTIFFLLVLCFIAVFPWPTIIQIPALFKSAAYTTVYPAQHGKITAGFINNNEIIAKGGPLFELFSPQLNFQKEQCQREVDILRMKLNKISFSDSGADQLPVVQKQLTEKLTALDGYQKQIKHLTVYAPISGRVVIRHEKLPINRWVNKTQPILTIIDDSKMEIEGYIHEQSYHQISDTYLGTFYPDLTEAEPFDVQITEIDDIDINSLNTPYLASTYGGDIPVTMSPAGTLTPHAGYYKIKMVPLPGLYPQIQHILRGSVRMVGKSKNLFQRIWPNILAVLIRESSF